jgi:hypothetical protein
MKKTLKQFIFNKLEKGEYILDQDVARFLGKEKEVNYYTVEKYKKEYYRFKNAKERFEDFENKGIELSKVNRKYLIRNNEMPEHQWFQIPKSYYEYLKEKGF